MGQPRAGAKERAQASEPRPARPGDPASTCRHGERRCGARGVLECDVQGFQRRAVLVPLLVPLLSPSPPCEVWSCPSKKKLEFVPGTHRFTHHPHIHPERSL